MGATIPQMGAAFPIVLQMGATDLCSHPDGGEFSCYADNIRSASSKYMQVDSFETDHSYEVFRNIADLFSNSAHKSSFFHVRSRITRDGRPPR